MRLRTVQMAKWRKVQAQGLVLTDTTAKGAIFGPFSPDWEFVKQYKDGVITEEEYTRLYTEKMRKSFQYRNQEWMEFLNREDGVIACFCPEGAFCHRLLLVDMMRRVCEVNNIPFCYMGEIP